MHDLRYAFRLIVQNWGFSLTVILILALCIGANTAVLSVVNVAIVRPLPYPEPDRLAQVVTRYVNTGTMDDSQNGRTWEAIRDRMDTVDAAVYGGVNGVNMGVAGSAGDGGATYVEQQRVSSGFFRVLGIAPKIGREFTPIEDRAGGPPAVILSNGVWIKLFNRDPGIIGRGVLLRGEPYTVVGVMPAGFQLALDSGIEETSGADVWTPLRPSHEGEGSGENYGIVARLRPGANWTQASSQLAALTKDLQPTDQNLRNARLEALSLQKAMTSTLRQPLMVVWAAVAFVFVLGCVNIGAMLLAKASGRVGEIATRMALGAPFSRIVRQLLVESALLGLLGGAAGMLLGWGGLKALQRLGGTAFPFLHTVSFDVRLLAATLGLTLLAGLAFGIFPALQASRIDLQAAYRSTRGGKAKHFLPMGALAAGQVALTVPLLIGAGLLLHTFLHLWNLNPGFDPNHVMTARFSLQDARYSTPESMNRLFEKTLDRLHGTPGIEAAAVTLNLPYERGLNWALQLPDEQQRRSINLTYVTPGYFPALRIPLLQGRLFTETDGPSTPRVALVNEAFVRRYFKNASPVGKSLRDGTKIPIEIVGVVGNVQVRPGSGDSSPLAQMSGVYVPAAQATSGLLGAHVWFSPNWIVRSTLTDGEAIAAIETATRSADPLLPVAAFRSISDLKSESLSFQRFIAVLTGSIAGLAILLSALGIYGLIANIVGERTKELGIRMALGSTAGRAIRTVMTSAFAWVLGGVAAGGIVSSMLAKFLKSFLWGVPPQDPLTLACVAAGLLMATLLASAIPAARIARVNPADTLRAD